MAETVAGGGDRREGARPPRGGAGRGGARQGRRPPRRAEGPAPAPHGIPPYDYAAHLEQEHGMTVTEEAGWPAEVKRYHLVRTAANGGRDKSLTTFIGTRQLALAHFYQYLHPAGEAKAAETPQDQPGQTSNEAA